MFKFVLVALLTFQTISGNDEQQRNEEFNGPRRFFRSGLSAFVTN